MRGIKYIAASLFALLSIAALAQEDRPSMEYHSLDHRTTLVVAYEKIGDAWIGANYLILEGDIFSVLLDTPWNDEQTMELLAWADTNLQHPIEQCIITHAHDDRMGGIKAIHDAGIHTLIHPDAQAMRGEFEEAKELLDSSKSIDLGVLQLEVVFPGTGHAPGNLLVKIGRHGVYGGCFIKSANSRSLGNLADADIESWSLALASISQWMEGVTWVIPGHGSTEKGAFERTVQLVEESLDELD